MKIKNTILGCILLLSVFLPKSHLYAQVKIGSNPTTIDLNNNLEVEASSPGRKTFINKTTGQVSIMDGTEAAGKIFTSDANGGGSWQLAGNQGSSMQVMMVNSTSPQAIPYQVDEIIQFGAVEYDKANNINGNSVVISENGTYFISGEVLFLSSANTGQDAMALRVYVNEAVRLQLDGRFINPGQYQQASGSRMVRLNAGDIITARFYTGQLSGTCSLIAQSFTVVKVSN